MPYVFGHIEIQVRSGARLLSSPLKYASSYAVATLYATSAGLLRTSLNRRRLHVWTGHVLQLAHELVTTWNGWW